MRQLKTFMLKEALTFLQRCHQRPEQLSTAALLKFQRGLDEIDRRLDGEDVQTVAEANALRALQAAQTKIEALEAQVRDSTVADDVRELLLQLRKDFGAEGDSLDGLYERITAARKEAVHGSRGPAQEPVGHSGAERDLTAAGAGVADRDSRTAGRSRAGADRGRG